MHQSARQRWFTDQNGFPLIPDDARPYPLKSGYDAGYRTGEAGYFGGAPMLTDVQARKAKAADRPYKLTDGGGLHVCVTPAGGKL